MSLRSDPLRISNLEKYMATISIPFQLKRGRPRRKVDGTRVIMLRAQGLSRRASSTGTAFRAAQGRSKIIS